MTLYCEHCHSEIVNGEEVFCDDCDKMLCRSCLDTLDYGSKGHACGEIKKVNGP